MYRSQPWPGSRTTFTVVEPRTLRVDEVVPVVSFASSVHHKGPVSQGMVLNVRDIAKAPRISIDEPQILAGAKALYTCMLVDIHKVVPGYSAVTLMYMLQNMSPRVPDRVDVVVPYSTKMLSKPEEEHGFHHVAVMVFQQPRAMRLPTVDPEDRYPTFGWMQYATEHGLGDALGGMYFHVREGDGTDEALKWDEIMSRYERNR